MSSRCGPAPRCRLTKSTPAKDDHPRRQARRDTHRRPSRLTVLTLDRGTAPREIPADADLTEFDTEANAPCAPWLIDQLRARAVLISADVGFCARSRDHERDVCSTASDPGRVKTRGDIEGSDLRSLLEQDFERLLVAEGAAWSAVPPTGKKRR